MSAVTFTANDIVADGETDVLYDGTANIKASLASDVDAGDTYSFTCTNTGSMEICDIYGRRIGFCPPGQTVMVWIREDGKFVFGAPVGLKTAAIAALDTAAASTGISDARLDLMIAAVNSLLAIARTQGFLATTDQS